MQTSEPFGNFFDRFEANLKFQTLDLFQSSVSDLKPICFVLFRSGQCVPPAHRDCCLSGYAARIPIILVIPYYRLDPGVPSSEFVGGPKLISDHSDHSQTPIKEIASHKASK